MIRQICAMLPKDADTPVAQTPAECNCLAKHSLYQLWSRRMGFIWINHTVRELDLLEERLFNGRCRDV